VISEAPFQQEFQPLDLQATISLEASGTELKIWSSALTLACGGKHDLGRAAVLKNSEPSVPTL
jgi:hypothetical protein